MPWRTGHIGFGYHCRYGGLVHRDRALGTFRYIVLRRRISGAESFTVPELWALRVRELLLFCAGMREEWYTEENTDVNVEWIPLSLAEENPAERIRRLMKDSKDGDLPKKEG